jgi:Na+-transporting NADH:ubiquinone oxidoreductase subunit C
MRRDSVIYTLLVALVLCVVCSVLVAASAVGLRGVQERNKLLDRQKNVLLAAHLIKEEEATPALIAERYEQFIEPQLIDLASGEPVDPSAANFDVATYDQRDAAKKPALSESIPAEKDLAGIRRREKYAYVYRVKGDQGGVEQLVLPVYGKGLWSTLYGFLALQADANTVGGITFYEHKETPGLGGEVENKDWQAKWVDKQVYGPEGEVELSVVRGEADDQGDAANYEVDGLSGATITSKGVSNLIHYWLGPEGFGPYLQKFQQERGGAEGG